MLKKEFVGKSLEAARTSYGRPVRPQDMYVALHSLCDVAVAELLGGGEVSFPGLGKFKVKETAERLARNPNTGEPIYIQAGKKVVFVPAKELKTALKP